MFKELSIYHAHAYSPNHLQEAVKEVVKRIQNI